MFEVLKYIHENIKNELTLAETANKFGYSKWHFCTKFHEYTGRSFSKYVRHFRIRLAALDILEGAKIIDIATMYGYDSTGGFNKAFLTEFGCYPSEYKKNSKSAQLYSERRKFTMIPMSERCDLLRKEVLDGSAFEDRFCAQHTVYTQLGYADAIKKGLTRTEVISAGVVRLLDSFMPVIRPYELVVGFNFADSNYYGEKFVPDSTEEGKRIMLDNGISESDIEKFIAQGVHKFKNIPCERFGKSADLAREFAAHGHSVCQNHTVLGYEQVLRYGFRGLLKRVEKYEKKNGSSPHYTAMKNICIAACNMGKKYAAEAERLIESNDESYVRQDLEIIAKVCKRVPEEPATTFHEAVQSLLFAHIINTWEDYINANSLGRLDQILYPYYKADIESGAITKEQAFELICCLWIKLYRNYDVQQSCVGGTGPNGESQVNDLSYLMLDAVEQLDFIRCLSVRYSNNTDKKFVKRALEVVGHTQKGVPFFFNDDVMIPALESVGISHEDACDYTHIGCVETVIPGKSNPHAVSGRVNLLKALEYALANGHSMMVPELMPGLETGDISSFTSFEKFYDAVLKQIKHLLDADCEFIARDQKCVVSNCPRPYKSLLTKGCVESGRDFNDYGACYDFYQVMLMGIPNLADSLEVIRKFVYQDKKYTLAQMYDILMNDYPDEAVRKEFINKSAKFGNDIDSVDDIAVNIVDRSCDFLEELSEKYGLAFHAQPFTFRWMIEHGKKTAASPDGRKKGEILAYSVSPMQGRDFNGLTAVLNSIAKFPTKRTPGTTSAIVEIDPKLFTDRNLPVLTDILFAASEKGLNNVQFNIVDMDMLIDAKNNPEKYNNLAVRVSGFSQKFNLLSPELQDHIIARTKHLCL